MILIEFIHDGHHKGWRYKRGERVELYDQLAQQAIDEGMAKLIQYTRVARKENSTSKTNAAYYGNQSRNRNS
jgi:hypothetical protein